MTAEADAVFVEKLRSIHFSRSSRRAPKVTTDVHDHHTVEVTETWDDQVGVTVKPETLVVPRTVARVSPSEEE